MVERYREDPNVEYAEPNYIAYAFTPPNDVYYGYQWHMDNHEYGGINMEAAWDIETGDTNVVVAVLDTGVAYEDYTQGSGWWRTAYYLAPDLAETAFVPGHDFVNNDSHPNDDNGHGTHVTGTIAQSTNNGEGVAGVAFNCSIMPVKVLDRYGSGTYADIADGIIFAADNGAHIINLSLGGSSDSATLKDAVAYAYKKGVTVVCSSGNDGSADTIKYPAAYDEYCIAVGATRYDETVAYYSNRGPSLDLVAPGGDLSVDQNNDGYGDGVLQQTFGNTTSDWGYWFYEGTSMAAPHVSGVAALLISNGMATTPDEVREALQSTAEDKGPEGWDSEYGWGLVDAYAALNYSAEVGIKPSVSTYEATGVAHDRATLNGHLGDLGSAPGVYVSFEYGTSSENYTHETVPERMTTAGSFSVVLSGLPENTTYYFRAKAVGDGTSCGGEKNFLTESSLEPEVPTADVSIVISKQFFWFFWRVTATVTVRQGDGSGSPVEGATVTGYWSGAYGGNVSGTTNGGGEVSFGTGWSYRRGEVCFTVDRVEKDGQDYELDGETTDCI